MVDGPGAVIAVPQLVFDHLCEAGWPHSMVEIARRGYRATGELLSPFVALLSQELTGVVHEEADPLPPEAMLGDVPGWAYDLYSREGRAALARFLKTDAVSAPSRAAEPPRAVPRPPGLSRPCRPSNALAARRWASPRRGRRVLGTGMPRRFRHPRPRARRHSPPQ